MAEAQPNLPLDPPAAAAPPDPAAAPAAEAVAAAAPAPSPEPAAAAAAPAVEYTSEKPSLLDFAKEGEKPAEGAPAEGEKPAAEAAKPVEPAKEAPAAEAKPADALKPAEAAAEAPKAAEPAAPITYNFDLPEPMKGAPANDPVMKTFTEALGEFRAPPELGQKLLNLHAEAMQGLANQKLADQHRAFNETRDGWRKDVLADEAIGGSGHQTAMKAIARMRDMLVPEKDRGDFEQFLRITGAGDHPQFLKLLHRAAKYFDEPGLPPDNPGVPPDIGRQNGKGSAVLYDHPRSNRNRN